ncbi:MAG: hypothetical protein GF308_14680 [Candidatus Heimdallarchaeota archaeon]|nr:hypothetical protein [Candidatus Heimdallarchaeota archaeon]
MKQLDLFGKPINREKLKRERELKEEQILKKKMLQERYGRFSSTKEKKLFFKVWGEHKKEVLSKNPKCSICGLKGETLHHTDFKKESFKGTNKDYIYSENVKVVCHLCHHFFIHASKKAWVRACDFCGYSSFRYNKNGTIICKECKRELKDEDFIHRPDMHSQKTMKILQWQLKTNNYSKWFKRMVELKKVKL